MIMEILKYHILALTIGYVLDLIIGDPHKMPHPIRLIGKMISWIERKTYENKKGAGLDLVGVVVCSTAICTGLLLYGAYKLNSIIGIVVEAVLSFYCLATKSLYEESNAVISALNKSGIEAARVALSMIVGRDTNNLSEEQVVKATIETIAENTSDGVVAPLFYLCIGGPVLGLVYKACNTMDSMVGYKNDRYLNYGYFAAKLDDILNFIPSRLSALLIILSAFILQIFVDKSFDGKRAYNIWKRDRFNHKSPNSAQSESAYAGAMGIRIAGGASYFGKWVNKPFIGDEVYAIKIEDVSRSYKLLFLTSILCEVLCTAVIFIITK